MLTWVIVLADLMVFPFHSNVLLTQICIAIKFLGVLFYSAVSGEVNLADGFKSLRWLRFKMERGLGL